MRRGLPRILLILGLCAWQGPSALASPPTEAVRSILNMLHNYDVERYDIEAELLPEGLRVQCDLRLKLTRAGPIRFVMSDRVKNLDVTLDGAEVPHNLGLGLLAPLIKRFQRRGEQVPALLTLRPRGAPEAGTTLTFRLSYLWAPGDGMDSYADAKGLQTHLSGFWVPTMADEMFEAKVRLRIPKGMEAAGPGARRKIEDGLFEFETWEPMQLLCLVAGRFRVRERKTEERVLRVLYPANQKMPEGRILDDLENVLRRQVKRFGPGPGKEFTLVFEPRPHEAASYCAGPFAVASHSNIRRARAEEGNPRVAWLHLLAHECAHIWWGHRVPTAVVGLGGTWLREGLAEWASIWIVGEMLDRRTERGVFRWRLRRYFGGVDVRAVEGPPKLLFANEATLEDATYLDPSRVPYSKGCLVFRILDHTLGREAFLKGLKRYAAERSAKFTRTADFVKAVDPDGSHGVAGVLAYYVNTAALPDLRLEDLKVANGTVTGRVVCADPKWPGGTVPVVLRLAGKSVTVDVPVKGGSGKLAWKGEGKPVAVEVDPERIYLDPVRSNSLWEAPGRD